MTWQDQIAFDRCQPSPPMDMDSKSRMAPGLTDTYDKELREKASVRSAPILPEQMGLEGEYDDYGLAKRVAQALDRHPQLAHLDSLSLVQQGNTIAFAGTIPDNRTLDLVVLTASQVDGTHAVDVSQVAIEQLSP